MTLPAEHLPGKQVPSSELTVWHYQRNGKSTMKFPALRGNTAILQYPGDEGSALYAMASEAEGKRLIVEVDDNYVDHGDVLWMRRAGWARRIKDGVHSTAGHRWIVEHANGVIVSTRALADVYSNLNNNVWICRNSIDPSDWKKPAKRDGVFRIGWYASGSHDRDSPLVRRALQWASRQPNVEVVNIGHDPGWGFTRRQVAWTADFKRQRAELLRLDVGVSPLVMSPLAKYRSDLKALEYAMGGAMPILQSSEPYWEWEDKSFAWICHTPKDWERAIKWAVKNQDVVRIKAERARRYVLRERTIATEVEKWRQAISATP